MLNQSVFKLLSSSLPQTSPFKTVNNSSSSLKKFVVLGLLILGYSWFFTTLSKVEQILQEAKEESMKSM